MERHTRLFTNILFFLMLPLMGHSAGPAEGISIRYFGQAAFLITSSSGSRILMDPAEFKGYKMPAGIETDIVTISHEHFDHNNLSSIAPGFTTLRGLLPDDQGVRHIDTTLNDIHIYDVPSFHDPGQHGFNAIFILEMDGLRIAHLGDIGTVLSDEQIREIGPIDILLIPVGGKYTITPSIADSLVSQVCHGSIIIPMHYRTEAFEGLPYTAEDFLKGKSNVTRAHKTEIMISPGSLAKKNAYYKLEYKD